MATTATLNVPRLRSITAGAALLPRGSRVVLNAQGTYDLAGIGIRGDMITVQDIGIGEIGNAAPINGGGSVPVLALNNSAIDDPAYSAATGQTGNATGGGAVYLGKWLQVAAAGALGVIELQSAA